MKYVIVGIMILASSLYINYYIQKKIYNRVFTRWYLYGNRLSLLFFGLILGAQVLLILKYDITVYYGIYSILTLLLITVAWIDIKTKRIPNWAVITGGVLGIISMAVNSDVTIYDSLVGALIMGGVLTIISLVTKGAIGMGDAKVFFFIGLLLGFWTSLSVFIISILTSGVVSLILLVFKVVNRKTSIPFAPFIFISTFLIIIL